MGFNIFVNIDITFIIVWPFLMLSMLAFKNYLKSREKKMRWGPIVLDACDDMFMIWSEENIIIAWNIDNGFLSSQIRTN